MVELMAVAKGFLEAIPVAVVAVAVAVTITVARSGVETRLPYEKAGDVFLLPLNRSFKHAEKGFGPSAFTLSGVVNSPTGGWIESFLTTD
jgi:hypothetical protein